jgi:hypothetical protein
LVKAFPGEKVVLSESDTTPTRLEHYAINPVTLALKDPTLEQRFKRAHLESSLQVGRMCHLLAIFFYCLIGVWDAVIIDPSRQQIWFAVVAVVTTVFLVGLLVSYVAPGFYARSWQELFAGPNL